MAMYSCLDSGIESHFYRPHSRLATKSTIQHLSQCSYRVSIHILFAHLSAPISPTHLSSLFLRTRSIAVCKTLAIPVIMHSAVI